MKLKMKMLLMIILGFHLTACLQNAEKGQIGRAHV